MQITESLVVPNMDDIPFFDTRAYEHRGGIWSEAGKREAPDPASVETSLGATSKTESKSGASSQPDASMGERRGSAPAAVEPQAGNQDDVHGPRHPAYQTLHQLQVTAHARDTQPPGKYKPFPA